jgi:hypothetical protein
MADPLPDGDRCQSASLLEEEIPDQQNEHEGHAQEPEYQSADQLVFLSHSLSSSVEKRACERLVPCLMYFFEGARKKGVRN